MELCKEIVEVVETHGFTLHKVEEQNGEYYVEMGQGTPEGEDWWECIWFDGTSEGFVEAVKGVYISFDVDEATEIWIESRGKNGVPSSIKALVADAEWKEKKLEMLSDALNELEFEEEGNNMSTKLTKQGIEKLVNELEEFLQKKELISDVSDVSLYFNNKCRSWHYDWRDGDLKLRLTEREDMDPHDYFGYAANKHILSMSFEGPLYAVLNGNTGNWTLEEQFRAILEKYNLYYELGNSWNLTCYPIKDMEVEYTMYGEPVKPIYLYFSNPTNIPPELKNIMMAWYELSKTVGDQGSCVIGAGFKFTWNRQAYFMGACSPWQGSLSWETHIKTVEKMLQNIGASDIHYDYGRMD